VRQKCLGHLQLKTPAEAVDLPLLALYLLLQGGGGRDGTGELARESGVVGGGGSERKRCGGAGGAGGHGCASLRSTAAAAASAAAVPARKPPIGIRVCGGRERRGGCGGGCGGGCTYTVTRVYHARRVRPRAVARGHGATGGRRRGGKTPRPPARAAR